MHKPVAEPNGEIRESGIVEVILPQFGWSHCQAVAVWISFDDMEELLVGGLQKVGCWHSCKVSGERSEWRMRKLLMCASGGRSVRVHMKDAQGPPRD